jgi:hypothetical protein
MLALLATLERRAKKAGEKSVVKGVVARLAAAGADRELIAKISTVGSKRLAVAKRAAGAKRAGRSIIKAKTKAKAATAKAKPSEPAGILA